MDFYSNLALVLAVVLANYLTHRRLSAVAEMVDLERTTRPKAKLNAIDAMGLENALKALRSAEREASQRGRAQTEATGLLVDLRLSTDDALKAKDEVTEVLRGLGGVLNDAENTRRKLEDRVEAAQRLMTSPEDKERAQHYAARRAGLLGDCSDYLRPIDRL